MLDRPPNATSEDGFTLIELLVAMIIAVVVIVGLVTLTLGAFGNAQKTEAERQAFEDVNGFARVLNDDLAKSKAPDRTEDVLSNPADVTDSLLGAEPLRRRSAGTDVTVDVADIVYASGQDLRIRTDVDVLSAVTNAKGVDGLNDCIRYFVDSSSGTPKVVRQLILYQPPLSAGVGQILPTGAPDGARG